MIFLEQSVARTVKIGPFVSSTDGFTPSTSLTITSSEIKLCKNGGTMAGKNNVTGAAHDANGYYSILLDATDTGTLGSLEITVNETGTLPVRHEFTVVPSMTYQSIFMDTAPLEVELTSSGLFDVAQIVDSSSEIATAVVDAINASPPDVNVFTMNTEVSDQITDSVWDEVATGHTTVGTFGALFQPASGTATAGAASTITLAVGSSSINDYYNDRIIRIIGGKGINQSRKVSDYVGSTRVLTVAQAWTIQPDNTSRYVIV